MLSLILSCIRNLTISFPGLSAADLRFIAAGLLGLAAENGTIAAPLAAIAAELDQPADRVLAVLRALADAGLVVLQVPPLAGDVAETWVVCWWAGFAGAGVTVNIYSGAAENGGGLSHADARAVDGGCLFVCSDPDPSNLDLEINKQTARARTRTCEGGQDAGGDFGRIVALLTDPAVTAGLLVKGSGAPVGAFTADKAREIAGVVLRAGGSFDAVLANVCQWRREVEAGRVWSPLPALRSRLERGFDGAVTAADRRLPWFAQHAPDYGWDKAEYAGIINRFENSGGDSVEDGGAGSVNVYSEPAEAATASAVDLGYWLPLVAGFDAAQNVMGGAIVERDGDGDGWIVRLDAKSRHLITWLQTKGARPVGRAIAAALNLGAQPVPVRFVDGSAAPVFGD